MAKFSLWQWLQSYIFSKFLLPFDDIKKQADKASNAKEEKRLAHEVIHQLASGAPENPTYIDNKHKMVKIEPVAVTANHPKSVLIAKAVELRDDIVDYLYPILNAGEKLPAELKGSIAMKYSQLDLKEIRAMGLSSETKHAITQCKIILNELTDIMIKNNQDERTRDLRLSKHNYETMTAHPNLYDEVFRKQIMEKYYQELQLPNPAPNEHFAKQERTIHSPSSRQR